MLQVEANKEQFAESYQHQVGKPKAKKTRQQQQRARAASDESMREEARRGGDFDALMIVPPSLGRIRGVESSSSEKGAGEAWQQGAATAARGSALSLRRD